MLDKFGENFKTVVETIRSSPTIGLLVLVLCLATLAFMNSANNNRILESLQDNPAVNASHFEESLERNKLVQETLESLRYRTGADRAVIKQFHNGKRDLTGIPFTYAVITHVSLKDGIALTPGSYESMPLSALNESLLQMWQTVRNPKCLAQRIDDVKDPLYRQYLTENQVVKYVACPLTNPLDYPIGKIVVEYTRDFDDASDDMLIQQVERAGFRVNGYLVKPADIDDSPWYKFW